MSLRALVPLIATTIASPVMPQTVALPSPAIDSYLADALERTEIPGFVALVTSPDGTIYSSAFGQQDVAGGRAMRTDAIFRIASMTKPVTAVAVMMLVEEGLVSLDDPIDKFLPGVVRNEVLASFDAKSLQYTTRPAATPVTVRHLMTNTSGLGYPWSNKTLFALLGGGQPSPTVTTLPLLFDPGTRWTYGESMRVLGLLVEKVSGQPMEAFYRERIFAPLGMLDTGWTLPETKRSRLVTAHRRTESGIIELPRETGAIGAPARGDGGLYSTAEDYARFLRMLLNEGRAPDGAQLLSEASVALMGQNQIGSLHVETHMIADTSRSRPFPLGPGRDRFGFGFQVTEAQGDSELRSNGSLSWAGIQNTQFWLDPARGIGAVLLMQYLPFYDDSAIATLEGFEREVYRHLED